jgi:hypothetical protein
MWLRHTAVVTLIWRVAKLADTERGNAQSRHVQHQRLALQSGTQTTRTRRPLGDVIIDEL